MSDTEVDARNTRVILGGKGLWCDACLTSARYSWGLHELSEDGPRRIASFNGCDTCNDDSEVPA